MVKHIVMGLGVMLLCAGPVGAIPLESWDDQVPSAGTRFKVLSEFGGAAVLDKETQLVWEQSPATTLQDWPNARFQCVNRTTGNRKGWRLPSVHELASLVDPSVSFPPDPPLPPGHPFLNVQSLFYWSASTVADDPTAAWGVHFNNGHVSAAFKASTNFVWCVRGGNNADHY